MKKFLYEGFCIYYKNLVHRQITMNYKFLGAM